MQASVWVTASVPAYHRWKDAPERVAFLRDYHRHVFHVRMEVPVQHDDRDVEFIQLKEDLQVHLDLHYKNKRFDLGCEHIARALMERFSASVVEVSEDGENGARLVR